MVKQVSVDVSFLSKDILEHVCDIVCSNDAAVSPYLDDIGKTYQPPVLLVCLIDDVLWSFHESAILYLRVAIKLQGILKAPRTIVAHEGRLLDKSALLKRAKRVRNIHTIPWTKEAKKAT